MLSLPGQLFSIVFVVAVGSATSVAVLMWPGLAHQPWFSPGTVVALLILNFFVMYYLWWRFLAKLHS